MKTKLVVFASGSGSNAENLYHHFKETNTAEICAIFCNNADAGVIDRANRLGIPIHIFNKDQFNSVEEFDVILNQYQADYIILAGFLWLFPQRLLRTYYHRVINIHPALLPKYGGKGMYGKHVHQAVLAAAEPEHGVTVHFVNENFDEGEIILQEKFPVAADATIQILEHAIHEIEFRLYPQAIEKVIHENQLKLPLEQLNAGLEYIRLSPMDVGKIELLVRRPHVDLREEVESATLSTDYGMLGDNWLQKPSSSMPNGEPHPAKQITIMNSRAAALIAQKPERWKLAGDQIYADLNLSYSNIPPGTQLKMGSAIVEITEPPHRGCKKFSARFGEDAMRFVNSEAGRELNLRGVNAVVVQNGVVRNGDFLKKI